MAHSTNGRIEAHVGPMFAGKTTKLLRLYHSANELGLKTLVVSHKLDNRYEKKFVVSHDGVKAPCTSVEKLSEIKIDDFHVIFIDEGQFMPDLVQFCKEAKERGKIVHVFGLDKDYLLREFRAITEIGLIADKISKLRGVCAKCGNDSTTTARLHKSEDLILIGSSEYEPRCLNCHTTPN